MCGSSERKKLRNRGDANAGCIKNCVRWNKDSGLLSKQIGIGVQPTRQVAR